MLLAEQSDIIDVGCCLGYLGHRHCHVHAHFVCQRCRADREPKACCHGHPGSYRPLALLLAKSIKSSTIMFTTWFIWINNAFHRTASLRQRGVFLTNNAPLHLLPSDPPWSRGCEGWYPGPEGGGRPAGGDREPWHWQRFISRLWKVCFWIHVDATTHAGRFTQTSTCFGSPSGWRVLVAGLLMRRSSSKKFN